MSDATIAVRWRRKHRFSQTQGRDFIPRLIQLIGNLYHSFPYRQLSQNPNVIMSNKIKTDTRFWKITHILQDNYCFRFFDSWPEYAIIRLQINNNCQNSKKIASITNAKMLCHHIDDSAWFSTSASVNITTADIENNPNLPWDWDGISANPNITLEFIEKYFYELDIHKLCANPLYFDDAVHDREIKRVIAARRSRMRELLDTAVYKEFNSVIIIYIDFE